MSKLKRITALILSVLMLMSMSVAVSAADTYPIYIANSEDGYIYTAYQIFSGTMAFDSNDNDILNVIVWNSSIDTTNIYTGLAAITLSDGSTPFTDSNGAALTTASMVAAILASDTTPDNEMAQLFADFIADYVVGVTASYSSDDTSSNGYYTITAPAGYYLIKNTQVATENGSATRYILAMTSTKGEGSASDPLSIKSDIPNVDKDLDKTDACIGDTVTFYLTASLPTDYDAYSTYNLIFHDTLSSGLDSSKVVGIYVYDSGDLTTNETNAAAQDTSSATECTTGYTVNTSATDGCSFEVSLDAKDFTSDSSALIQVVFEATLNSDAVIGGEGSPNEVYLEYSNDMYGNGTGKTVTDKVITWTYELDVTKVDADDGTAITTGSAEFILYRLVDDGTGTEVKEYVQVDDSTNKVTGWTKTESEASILKSSTTDGKFYVIGLDIGTYYLEETKAPTGYNLMSDPVAIKIDATHTTYESGTWLTDDATKLDSLTITLVADSTTGDGDLTTGVVETSIQNKSGAELPSTGGIGTTIFYIVGGVLVVGAIILLITKKRMGEDDK